MPGTDDPKAAVMADLVDMAFFKAFRRLSKSDQKEARRHQAIYGQCWLQTEDDGSVTLLDPRLIWKGQPDD